MSDRRSPRLRRRVIAMASVVFAIGATIYALGGAIPQLMQFEARAYEQAKNADTLEVEPLDGGTQLVTRSFAHGKATDDWLNVVISPDSAEIFSAYPPEPIHLAIVIHELTAHRSPHLAIAYPLSWENVDPLSLSAFEDALHTLDRSTIGAPLTLAATPTSLPPALLASSLPSPADTPPFLSKVNALALPDHHLGTSQTLVGFTSVTGSEALQDLPAIALWGDRILLSYPLLVILQSLELGIEDLSLAESRLLLGDQAVIQLDDFGRAVPPENTPSAVTATPLTTAADLVAPVDDSPTLPPRISTVSLSAIDSGARSAVDSLLAATAFASEPRIISRASPAVVLSFLAALAILLALTQLVPRPLSFAALALIIVISLGSVVLIDLAQPSWMPISAVGSSLLTALFFPSPLRRTTPSPAANTTLQPTTPQKKAAKKTTTKKAAKKTAPRKTAAKKSPRKTAKKSSKKTAKKAPRKTAKKTAQKSPKSPPGPKSSS